MADILSARGARHASGHPFNILLDIDDTLFPSTEFSSMARRNALNAMISMGLGTDYAVLDAKLKAIIAARGSNYQNHFDDLCKELGVRRPGRYVAAAVAAYHDTKTGIQPFPKAPLALMGLKQAGHRLYVATNGSSIKQWDKLIRLRLALYFDDVFVSEELGAEKGEAFYRKILKTLDAKPEACVMVGDREDADILPAKAAGIRTVRLLAGKYAGAEGRTGADYAIKDIGELRDAIKALAARLDRHPRPVRQAVKPKPPSRHKTIIKPSTQ
jgi:putative hydrolase of the HAD superfamily